LSGDVDHEPNTPMSGGNVSDDDDGWIEIK
jgi:hypothetical protein